MAFNPNYPIFGREPLNHKTGVTREMFIKELGKLYNKPTDRAYLQALGLTQEEINQIVPMPQGTISYPARPSFVNVFGDKAFRVHQKTLYYRK